MTTSRTIKFLFRVNILTLVLTFCLTGCSTIEILSYEDCKNHAYLRNALSAYITQRSQVNQSSRLGIIPFSEPANLAGRGDQFPAFGDRIAWKIKHQLLATSEIPIVEILNRGDWPRKKAEYFPGNYEALYMAKAAGYDLVMLGRIEELSSLDELSVYSKVIEVGTGVTVWNGKTVVTTSRNEPGNRGHSFWFRGRQPPQVYSTALLDKAASCLADYVMEDPEENIRNPWYVRWNPLYEE